jgi:hypothetical protein
MREALMKWCLNGNTETKSCPSTTLSTIVPKRIFERSTAASVSTRRMDFQKRGLRIGLAIPMTFTLGFVIQQLMQKLLREADGTHAPVIISSFLVAQGKSAENHDINLFRRSQ